VLFVVAVYSVEIDAIVFLAMDTSDDPLLWINLPKGDSGKVKLLGIIEVLMLIFWKVTLYLYSW